MRFGYARVSAADQNPDRQVDALLAEGIERRNVFVDRVSGARESRPALDDMLSRLREGDTVVVLSFDRLARSTRQLLSLAERFEGEGVNLVSLHERIDTTTPQGKLFFTVSSAFAEFERAIIKERQREGIEAAKRRRGSCGGRRPTDVGRLDSAITLYLAGKTAQQVRDATGVSRSTLYRELERRGVRRSDQTSAAE